MEGAAQRRGRHSGGGGVDSKAAVLRGQRVRGDVAVTNAVPRRKSSLIVYSSVL